MADRTHLLIERNHALLAQAEAAQREARHIMARAQRARSQCQIMQQHALLMRIRFPSPVPLVSPLNRKTTS